MAAWTLRSPRGALFEPVLLAVTLSTAALWLGWNAVGLPQPVCLMHRFTGLPCPTCGGTRSALALLGGDVVSSFRWNPGVTLGLLLLGLVNAYALAVVVFRRPRLVLEPPGPAAMRVLRVVLVVALVANWGYLIAVGR